MFLWSISIAAVATLAGYVATHLKYASGLEGYPLTQTLHLVSPKIEVSVTAGVNREAAALAREGGRYRNLFARNRGPRVAAMGIERHRLRRRLLLVEIPAGTSS
jgi:hypothetical protein